MKRKVIYISTAYAVGLIFASISLEKLGILVILSGFLVFFSFCKALSKNFKEVFLMLISFLIAFGTYRFYNCYIYNTLLKFSDTDGYFSGKIVDITDYEQDNSRYILSGTINDTIDADIICYNTSYNCSIGDTMSFDCTFSKINGDYLFDSENYYKSKNIFLYADNIQNLQIEKYDGILLKNILYDYRDKIKSKFRLNMSKEGSAFLSAMVFGDKSNMEDSAKTLLYRSGIGHIMAISGIHAAICAGLLIFLLKKLHVNKFISFGILCVFLVLMIIIVESPVSVIRASIMIVILYSSRLFTRENDTLNSLAIAVLLICLSNPFIVHNQGFLLSVSGTYGIGVLAPYMTKNINSKILKNLLGMFYVSVCVMPLSLMYFDEVSIISPVTNMAIIPLCTISLIIGFIYVMSGGFVNLLFAADFIIKIINFITVLIGNNSWVFINGNSSIVFILFLSLFITCISAYFIIKKRRLINIIIALGMVFLFGYNQISQFIHKNIFKVTILGRNSNAAAVISYNGNTDIIDLSGHYKSPAYVSKFLSQNHIQNVNNLLLTAKKYSSYSTYKSTLELVDVKNIYIFSDNEILIKYSDYTIRYDNGILSVSFGSCSVCIAPHDFSGGDIADIFIFYGSPKKNQNQLPDGIVTDKFNNFSLEFYQNSFNIRRL